MQLKCIVSHLSTSQPYCCQIVIFLVELCVSIAAKFLACFFSPLHLSWVYGAISRWNDGAQKSVLSHLFHLFSPWIYFVIIRISSEWLPCNTTAQMHIQDIGRAMTAANSGVIEIQVGFCWWQIDPIWENKILLCWPWWRWYLELDRQDWGSLIHKSPLSRSEAFVFAVTRMKVSLNH